jgi:hypothetical protein
MKTVALNYHVSSLTNKPLRASDGHVAYVLRAVLMSNTSAQHVSVD